MLFCMLAVATSEQGSLLTSDLAPLVTTCPTGQHGIKSTMPGFQHHAYDKTCWLPEVNTLRFPSVLGLPVCPFQRVSKSSDILLNVSNILLKSHTWKYHPVKRVECTVTTRVPISHAVMYDYNNSRISNHFKQEKAIKEREWRATPLSQLGLFSSKER